MTSMPAYEPWTEPIARPSLGVLRRGPIGNDGLTDRERAAYASRYAAGPGRGMTSANRSTLAAIRARKRAG